MVLLQILLAAHTPFELRFIEKKMYKGDKMCNTQADLVAWNNLNPKHLQVNTSRDSSIVKRISINVGLLKALLTFLIFSFLSLFDHFFLKISS